MASQGVKIPTQEALYEAFPNAPFIDDAMRRLLSYGVDGIMTDRPDVLARVLNSR